MSAGRIVLLVVVVGVANAALLLLTSCDRIVPPPKDRAVAPTADLRMVFGSPPALLDDSRRVGERRLAAPMASTPTREQHAAPTSDPTTPFESGEPPHVDAVTSRREAAERLDGNTPDRGASAVSLALVGRIPGPSTVARPDGAGDVGGADGHRLQRPTGMEIFFGSLLVLDDDTNELIRYRLDKASGPAVAGIYPLNPKRMAESRYLHWDQVGVHGNIVYVTGKPAQIVDFTVMSDRPLIAEFPDDLEALAIAVAGTTAWVATSDANRTYDVIDPQQPDPWMDDEWMWPHEEGTGAAVSADRNVYAFRYGEAETMMAYQISSYGSIYPHAWLDLNDIVDGFEGFNPPSVEYQGGRFYLTHEGGLAILENRQGSPTTSGASSPTYQLLASWPTDWPATHVEVDWPYVALSDANTVYLLDITDISSIEEVDRYQHGSGSSDDLAMSVLDDDRLYVLNSVTGVHILDLQ